MPSHLCSGKVASVPCGVVGALPVRGGNVHPTVKALFRFVLGGDADCGYELVVIVDVAVQLEDAFDLEGMVRGRPSFAYMVRESSIPGIS